MAAFGEETTGRRVRWGLLDLVVVVYALIPVLWIVSLSFKPPELLTDGRFIPADWTWENYTSIFQTDQFTRALINSIGIALISTAIAVVLGMMAAYAVARLDFPGKRLLIGVSLLIAMFPQVSLVSPLFDIERQLGLFDTWPGLIIPYITFALPLAIYTQSAFFRQIPWDLEKAAKMDGATQAQAFRRDRLLRLGPALHRWRGQPVKPKQQYQGEGCDQDEFSAFRWGEGNVLAGCVSYFHFLWLMMNE